MKITNSTIIRILSITTGFLVAIFLLFQIRTIIIYLLTALLIAAIVDPVVSRIQRFMPKKNRVLAMITIILFFFAILSLLGFIIVNPLVKELKDIIGQREAIVSQLKENKDIQTLIDKARVYLPNLFQPNVVSYAKQSAFVVGNSAGTFFSGIMNFVLASMMIFILSLFMLVDMRKAVKSLEHYIPQKHQGIYERLTSDLFGIVSKYVSGVFSVAFFAGLSTFIALSILRVRYALALAVFVALLDLVPMIGATLGAVVVTVLVFGSKGLSPALILALYYTVYQLFENYVLMPAVQRRTVKVSAIGILVALLIGGRLGGDDGGVRRYPCSSICQRGI